MSKSNYRQHAERNGQAIQKWMTDATGMVKVEADRVENEMLNPAYERYQNFARDYPGTTFFVSLFAMMSVIPVTSYIIFSTVVFSSLVFVAISAAVVTALSICAFVGGFLLLILVFIVGAATFGTFTYLSSMLAYRLAFHLLSEDGEGLVAWIKESLSRLGFASNELEEPAASKDVIITQDERKTKRDSGEWHAVGQTEPSSLRSGQTIDPVLS